MGYTSYSTDASANMSRSYSKKSTDDIFINNRKRKVDDTMSPHGIIMREARDSDLHPAALAIILGLDMTGSMGHIPESLVKGELRTIMEKLIDHKVVDPAVLFLGIGDSTCDSYPLQVGQFESGAEELYDWLTKLYLERGGGGQNKESYADAWYFAANYTSIDCYEKRKEKGYLFTIGDEYTWGIDGERMKSLFGLEAAPADKTPDEMLDEVSKLYNVYHIHVNQTGYKDDPSVIEPWRNLLGERLILVDDYTTIASVIASLIAIQHGVDKDAILGTFDAATAAAVGKSLINIDGKNDLTKTDSGVHEL